MVEKRKNAPASSTQRDNNPQPSPPPTKKSRVDYGDLHTQDYGSEENYGNDDDETHNGEWSGVEDEELEDDLDEDEPETRSLTQKRFDRSGDSAHTLRRNREDNNQAKKGNYERPRNDPLYGQKSAFPGLDDPFDAETLLYGDPEDGLEYLRMVRSEANSLPAFFKAPTLETAEPGLLPVMNRNGDVDGGQLETTPMSPQRAEREREAASQLLATPLFGRNPEDPEPLAQTFYSNGVFFVRNTPISKDRDYPQKPNIEQNLELSEHQTTYRTLLHHRFLLLRSTLRCSPPASSIAALDDAHPISFPSQVRRARTEWRRLLLDVDPQMVQLACMDETSVFAVLALLGRSLGETVKNRDLAQIKRAGAWAWALLGRCREVGQLGSEEVSEIRDIGKRAAKILEKLRSVERNEMGPRARSFEDDANEGDGDRGAEDDDSDFKSLDEVKEVLEMVDEAAHTDENAATVGNPAHVEDIEALEAAKLRLQARLNDTDTDGDGQSPSLATTATDNGQETATVLDSIRSETHAMLDMILTIVGEFYGQRDLLASRDIWLAPD